MGDTNVYITRADPDHYEMFGTANEDDLDRILDGFKGIPMIEAWTPIAIKRLIVEPGDAALPPSDFPSFGSTPVFSAHAVDELADLLEGRGELLPLFSSEGEYYAYNVLRVVDALNEQTSGLARFDDGRIMNVDAYDLIPNLVEEETIFKLPQIVAMYEFVTDAFVDRVQERGLTGFLFQKVWPGPKAPHPAS